MQESNREILSPLVLRPDRRVVIEEIGLAGMDEIERLNRLIFGEDRIINRLDREGLLMIVARIGDAAVGFKVGYRENRFTFYSAKGGVLQAFRRQGVARRLLYHMSDWARENDYVNFAFDTFPNKHPGMAILGLAEGFRISKADYNPVYKDYRLRLEKRL